MPPFVNRVAAALGICLAGCASQSPVPHRLVNAASVQPPMLLEIRYATPYNFTRHTLYPAQAAYVRAEVAAALARVQRDLARQGLGLKIFDGYRPISVQQKMWDLIRDDRYVSDPAKNKGRHTRGTAVDVTLVDADGNELAMPTAFDDFSARAHRNSPEWTATQRRNSLMLEKTMQRHGFVPYPYEWWHFDFVGWESRPPLDIGFDDLARGVKKTVPVP